MGLMGLVGVLFFFFFFFFFFGGGGGGRSLSAMEKPCPGRKPVDQLASPSGEYSVAMITTVRAAVFCQGSEGGIVGVFYD